MPTYELAAVAAPSDTTTPTVSSFAFPTPPTTGTAVYQFTVTYSDNVAINVATLSSTNIKVTGPKGYSKFATLVSVSKTNNGTPRTATYQILAPSGGWSTAANSTFTTTLLANCVKDTTGNAVASRVVCTFKVA